MSIRVPDLPDIGMPTDDALIVGDHVGTGVYRASVLRNYVLGGTISSLTVDNLTANSATITGNLGVNGASFFLAEAQMNNDLQVMGTIQADGTLIVTGSSSLAGNATIGGTLGVNGTSFFLAKAQISADLQVDGSAYKPGGGPWADVSDARIKTDVQDYATGLAEVLQLRPVSYTFRPETRRSNQTHYGLIAQEVETVMPEMVTAGPGKCGDLEYDDMRTLDTQALTFALINAIRTLDARLVALEAAGTHGPPPEPV